MNKLTVRAEVFFGLALAAHRNAVIKRILAGCITVALLQVAAPGSSWAAERVPGSRNGPSWNLAFLVGSYEYPDESSPGALLGLRIGYGWLDRFVTSLEWGEPMADGLDKSLHVALMQSWLPVLTERLAVFVAAGVGTTALVNVKNGYVGPIPGAEGYKGSWNLSGPTVLFSGGVEFSVGGGFSLGPELSVVTPIMPTAHMSSEHSSYEHFYFEGEGRFWMVLAGLRLGAR